MIALMSAMTFSLTSCTDDCKDIACENGGICDTGVCDCTDGYEGELCADAFSDKFVGTYNGDDDCGFTYQSVVTMTDATTLSISNFAGTNTAATATVTSTEITIANQTNGAFTVSGTGSISGTTISIDYTLDADGADPENCKVTYTK